MFFFLLFVVTLRRLWSYHMTHLAISFLGGCQFPTIRCQLEKPTALLILHDAKDLIDDCGLFLFGVGRIEPTPVLVNEIPKLDVANMQPKWSAPAEQHVVVARRHFGRLPFLLLPLLSQFHHCLERSFFDAGFIFHGKYGQVNAECHQRVQRFDVASEMHADSDPSIGGNRQLHERDGPLETGIVAAHMQSGDLYRRCLGGIHAHHDETQELLRRILHVDEVNHQHDPATVVLGRHFLGPRKNRVVE
mmetsp:Transcript_3905/g.10991  ORF Transcript_3905/g.10991 Transcript_3905/m.10991 type:complete len:247 (+) Transcript_3905:64-804(+)